MADPKSVFKALTAGISFNKKRFVSDAQRFGLTTKSSPTTFESAIDEVVLPDPLPESRDTSGANSSDENDNDNQAPANKADGFRYLSQVAEAKKRLHEQEDQAEAVATKKLRRVKPKSKKMKEIEQRQHMVRRFRNQHRIHVFGTDVPDPIDEWAKLETAFQVDPSLTSRIASRFAHPTPVQMQAIPVMLERRDMIVCAPTGSGKTAAFLIPTLLQLNSKKVKKVRLSVVIVVPTRELAGQIVAECSSLCRIMELQIKSYFLEKTVRPAEIMVTTPNRLVYLLQQTPPPLSLKHLELLVIDESDKLFECGDRGFREQLAVIYKACTSSGFGVKCCMFSATLAVDVENWCKLNLDNVVTMTIGERNTATTCVEQKLIYAGTEKGKLLAFWNIVREGLDAPALLFVQSIDRAKELHQEILKADANFKVDVMHAERSQLQRDQTMKNFRCGRVWVLICTELLGRGIDFKGVNLVINYDFPPSTVSYIHRIGRTGRAGRPGKAVTFFTDADATLLRSIAHLVHKSGGSVPDYMLKLKKASRKDKRFLAKHPVKRASVSRETKFDKQRRLLKEKAIKKSKASATSTTTAIPICPEPDDC